MSGLIDSTFSTINIDSALSAVMENKLLLAAAPAIAIGTLSIGSRVVMGAMALGCKGASSIVNYIDGDLSEAINDTADELLSLAKRSFTLELQVAAGLTALTVAGIAISEFLFTQPEVTRLDKVTDFIGLTTPQYSNMEHITNFIGLTVPVTRTDHVIAAASWVGEKIGNAYEYVPSPRNVFDGYIAVCRTIDMICIEIIMAPFVITKYAIMGTVYAIMGTAFAAKVIAIASLKALILPLRVMFFCADKVNALYQSLPTAETIAYVAAWPFETTFKIITWPVITAYHIVTWPFITAYNIAAWPIIQAQYVANQIYEFVQNCIVWPFVAVKNMIFSPIETLGHVSEGLRDIVEQIKSVVTFLELDDSISQIVAWPINIVSWPFVKAYNIITFPIYLAGEIAEFIKNCFVWPVVAVTDAVFSPVETVRYVVVDGIGGALQAIVEGIRSLSTAISNLDF
jgi:hypothetical protein